MKYHAYLSKDQGLNSLPTNPCKLLDFNLLKLADGQEYASSTGDREILAVILGGRASFEVNGTDLGVFGGRPNVFSGKPYSVYLPAGVKYVIKAVGSVEIALPSAPSEMEIDAYVIHPYVKLHGDQRIGLGIEIDTRFPQPEIAVLQILIIPEC